MYVIKWWLALFAVGIVFFPTTALVLSKFDDKGWIFSKVIGLALSSIVLWNLSYLKILKFTPIVCYLVIAFFAIINFIIIKKKKEQLKEIKYSWKKIVTIEMIFLFVFIVCTYVRSLMCPLNNVTEHFMNYGFINRLMNTEYLPAEDIWLSGNPFNYYYYGHYITAFINKISTTGVEESYNLMLALLATFLFVLPYSLVKNLGNNLIKDDKKKITKAIPALMGLLVALTITFSGTVYYTVYKLILNDEDYFYPNPCYYIGHRPETNDQTITAFPSYMNIEGDLHAHHMDTMFALTTFALLLQYMLSDEEENKVKKYLNIKILLLGIMLAIQKMTNYWDFPIYLVIMGAVITVKNCIKYKSIKQKIIVTVIQLLEIVLIEELLALTFSSGLYISASKVYMSDVRSPFYKLAVLWGLPVICIAIDVLTHIYKCIKEKKGHLFKYIKEMNLSDVYILVIAICAIGLIIMPEIIYLKDVTAERTRRANTMFKLVFNAATMLNICTGYIIIKHLYQKGLKLKKVFITIVLVVLITTFGYEINAIKATTNNFKNKALNLRSVDNNIKTKLPDDYEAIKWIRQNIDPNDVILQKTNNSYTIDTRISVFTGNPTVLGWYGHQWTWRAKEDYTAPDIIKKRWSDIYTIYQSQNKETVESLIKEYNISYIYIGNVEYKEISNINYELLLSIGEVVYRNDTNYKQTPVYIIKCQ